MKIIEKHINNKEIYGASVLLIIQATLEGEIFYPLVMRAPIAVVISIVWTNMIVYACAMEIFDFFSKWKNHRNIDEFKFDFIRHHVTN